MRLRILPSYPDYGVCRDGRVYRFSERRLVRLSENPLGHKHFIVQDYGKPYYLHRALGECYISKPRDYEGELVVNHIDGNPRNNRLDNLEWITQSENIKKGVQGAVIQSRYPGVSRQGSKWKAYPYIKKIQCQVFLGYFDTEEEAHSAIIEEKKKFIFCPFVKRCREYLN